MAFSINIHFAADIVARAGPTSGAPLTIAIDRKAPCIPDEVCLFTDDHELSRKLADAINATVRAHRAEKRAEPAVEEAA